MFSVSGAISSGLHEGVETRFSSLLRASLPIITQRIFSVSIHSEHTELKPIQGYSYLKLVLHTKVNFILLIFN